MLKILKALYISNPVYICRLWLLSVPVVAGLLLGVYRAGYALDFSPPMGVFYWVVIWVTVFSVFFASSFIIHKSFNGRISFDKRDILGGLIGSLVSTALVPQIALYFLKWNLGVSVLNNLQTEASITERLLAISTYTPLGILLWVCTNHVLRLIHQYDAISGQYVGLVNQRYSRYKFLESMPDITESQVLAVSAADHYIHITTNTGSHLCRYRFSDALEQLTGDDGIQVHRSHWVRKEAIKDVVRNGRKWRIILKSGNEIPVSQAYLGLVQNICR